MPSLWCMFTSVNNMETVCNANEKKFFSVDIEKTEESIRNLHKCFTALSQSNNEGDTCVVSLQTQKEIFQDLCTDEQWDSFIKMDITSKFKAFPWVGRTILIENPLSKHPVPWKTFTFKVKHMPKVHSIANTNFFAPHRAFRDERWDCVIPTYRFDKTKMSSEEVRAMKQLMTHVVSHMVTKSCEYFIPDIIVILCSGVVEYLLKQNTTEPWMEKDFALAEYLVDFYSSRNFRRYLSLSETGIGWPKCLVIEIVTENLKCNHLKKFLLACFLQARKQAVNAIQLKSFYIQCMVELSGRYYSSLHVCEKRRPLGLTRMKMEMFHQKTLATRIKYSELARMSYDRYEFFDRIKEEARKIVNELGYTYVRAIHGVEFAPVPNRLEVKLEELKTTFKNLAALAKVDGTLADITTAEKMACLFIGYSTLNSLERNKFIHADMIMGIGYEGLFAMASGDNLMETFTKCVVDSVPKEWIHIYEIINEGFHTCIPCPIPLEYCVRIKEETGVDVEKEADINPETRLPRLACAHKECRFFMVPVRKRSKLDWHLQCVGERRIEALHKVMSNIAYRERLNEAVEAIKSGRELTMPKEGEMYLEDLSESVTAALESGMRVKGMETPEIYLRDLVVRVGKSYETPQCSYEEFKEAVGRAGYRNGDCFKI